MGQGQVQIQNLFLTVHSTQNTTVISVPIKYIIHHYPMGLCFTIHPGSRRTLTAYPGGGVVLRLMCNAIHGHSFTTNVQCYTYLDCVACPHVDGLCANTSEAPNCVGIHTIFTWNDKLLSCRGVPWEGRSRVLFKEMICTRQLRVTHSAISFTVTSYLVAKI